MAVKNKLTNYNVQLYSKIILEDQFQHSTKHLTINEVSYDTDTESQFQGITDAGLWVDKVPCYYVFETLKFVEPWKVVGFSENCDYLFMFGSFPSQLNVQVLHQSEVKEATVKHKNDAINLTLDCLETKLGSKVRLFDHSFSLFVENSYLALT